MGAKQGHKGVGYVLPAPVAMECQFFRITTILKGVFERCRYKMCAALLRNAIAHHPAGKQVNDDAEV